MSVVVQQPIKDQQASQIQDSHHPCLLLHLRNLDGNIADGTAVQVGTSTLNNVIIVDIRDSKGIGLAAPRTIPVNTADLSIFLVEIKAALCTRRGIGSTARGNPGRLARRNRRSVYRICGDFGILVTPLIELAPVKEN